MLYSGGFHHQPGEGHIEFVFWFKAFDTDQAMFLAANGATTILLTPERDTAWRENARKLTIEEARPFLSTLKQLGLPDGRLEGGGISEGSETWEKLTLWLSLSDGQSLRQCTLGGYDWEKKLPRELRVALGQLMERACPESEASYQLKHFLGRLVGK